MTNDFDLSAVISDNPVNLSLIILERQYAQIRAVAAKLRDEHPDLDDLIIAREKHDWRRVDELLSGRAPAHRP